MSTRTNIVIEYGESRVYLYRHHDGYLAGTGAALVVALNGAGSNTSQFVQSLLDERYDKQSYETEAKRVYELTSEIHGDIEYLYRVSFSRGDGEPYVGYSALAIGSERPDNANGVRLGSLADFVLAVNAEIRAQNLRLAKLKKEQPAAYGSSEPEPEVAVTS